MTKRKERSIRELYDVTERIPEAEMTPVLKGNFRIQGPMDGTDGTEKKTSSSRLEKRFTRRPRSTTGKVSTKAESGTCNVCASPCSSCRHFNQTVSCMEVKAENVFSDEVSGVNAATRCSFDNKKRVRTGQNPAASETSNLLSASSSHDSISENAESKASLRNFDTKEDVEMLPKVLLDGAVAQDQLLTKAQGGTGQTANMSSIGDVAIDAGQRTIANKSKVQNSCIGDDVSCISGDNDAHIPVRDLNVDIDGKNVSCSAASVSSLSPDGFEKKDHVQSDPDRLAGSQTHMFSEKFKQMDHLISSSNEKLLHKPDPSKFSLSKDSKGFNENLCSHQYVESPSEKLETFLGAQSSDINKNDDAPKLENSKSGLIHRSSSGTSMKDDSCLEVGIAVEKAKPPAKSMEHLEINKQIEKSSVLPKIPSNQDPPSNSQSADVSDGSDIVEDDVKVCDICGDAGREDLLAICSRCSDGAEHTYCMRIMMDKVPEGDWLCEVCQLKEEAADQKKDKCEAVVEKNKKSVRTLDSKISLKSDTQFPNEEADRVTKVAPSPRPSSKRHSDNLEVPSAVKQQALESSAGSPKPSSPSKTNTLSKERSFKNLDKGKVKSIHPIPSLGGSSSQDKARPPTPSAQNSSKVHPQLQSPRGSTLLKSSSFNTSNTKAKVKMVQDDVPQKNKLGKHPSTTGSRKEGVGTFSKSSSFNIRSSHLASIESKAKIHSSNVSRAEDFKGFKLGKEPNTLDRRNSFKSDRIGSVVSSPKDEQRVSSRGEIVTLPSSATKFRDMKAVQADGRLSASSKSTSLLSHRGSETSNPLAGRGEFKRQSSLVSRGGGYSPFNGNSTEPNLSQVNPKDEIATNLSCTADGSDMVSQVGLPRSQESMDQDKKGEEPSLNQARQSVPVAGKNRCQKCKEIGHAAQVCPNGSIRVSILEAVAARSSREVMNRSTKSKDANEASSVKGSGICKRSGLPDQSDELSTSSTEEMAPKKQLSNLGNFTSSDRACERQESFKNYTADSSRSTAVTNVKHNAFQPRGGGACAPREVDLNAIVSSDGIRLTASLCDAQNQDSSVATPSRGSPIPKQDYIWQGGFEVQKSGRHLDSFDGIQAHLSTCASPKVLEVVNRLPHNVLLEEVSRSSTWPTQFQNFATEDSIALYFFAKDVESYIRSYESLVENMMKNDLALKGILDGIELLIFPSNQLCDKSKRWNMLYFLWGVFRAKRANTPEKIDGSLKNLSAANLNVVPLEEKLPSPVMAVIQNDSSSVNIDEDLPTLGRSLNGQETINLAALMPFPSSLSSGKVDTRNYQEESSSDQKCLGLEAKSSTGRIDLNSHSSLMNPASNVQLCTSITGNDTLMLESVQEARENSSSPTKGKTVLLDDRPGYPEETSSLSRDAYAVGSRVEVNVHERMKGQSRRENVRDEEGMLDADFVLENEHSNREIKSNHKRPCSATVDMVPQASGESSACTSQLVPWKAKEDGMLVEEENERKKLKRVHNEANSRDGCRGDNSLTFAFKEEVDEAYDITVVPGSFLTTERHFFPVESGLLKDAGARGTSIPVQVISSDDEDQPEDERPDLNLALGGEKKSPKHKSNSLFELYTKKRNGQGKCPEITMDSGEDDSLDSLSLSLAVPLSNKAKPVARPEPERNHRDNSLSLSSGGFSGT